MILVIAEQRDGKLNRATWETIAGAQQLAAQTSAPITVLVPGANGAGVAAELAAAQVKEVVTVEHAALEPYTPDGFTAVLQDAIGSLAPAHVLLPHTYQTRDFAPKLAARLDRALITDVTAVNITMTGNSVAVRFNTGSLLSHLGTTEDSMGKYGAIALYVGGTSSASFQSHVELTQYRSDSTEQV